MNAEKEVEAKEKEAEGKKGGISNPAKFQFILSS
jgi:hypothetical protein